MCARPLSRQESYRDGAELTVGTMTDYIAKEPYPGATPLATAAWKGQVDKVKVAQRRSRCEQAC